ncbi:MAG: hypothetical protein MdMp024_0528 [Bacteroidales bacterium]
MKQELINHAMESTMAIPQSALPYPESKISMVKVGESFLHVYVKKGIVYVKVRQLLKYLGYRSYRRMVNRFVKKSGKRRFIQMEGLTGGSPAHFMDYKMFSFLFETSPSLWTEHDDKVRNISRLFCQGTPYYELPNIGE